jgi:hypothetical protein
VTVDEIATDVLAFVVELIRSGNVEKYGYKTSTGRIERLLAHVVEEGINVLRHEDETLSIEYLGGISSVRRLQTLIRAAKELPDELRPDFERTITQMLHENSEPGELLEEDT